MNNDGLTTEVVPAEEPKGPNIFLIIAIVVLVVICCCCIALLTSLYFIGDWILDVIRSFFYQFGYYFQT